MRPGLISLLCCPICERDLRPQDSDLFCTCGRRFPVRSGVPCLIPGDRQTPGAVRTRFSFDTQWRLSADTFAKDEVYGNQFRFDGITEREDVRNRLFLDAGCGSGRFTCVALNRGARVVALDFTTSGTRETLQRAVHPNFVGAVQADILNLPLRPEMFDVVFSVGVIHHTANVRLAFERLTRALKPGGLMVLGVYRTFPGVNAVRSLRKFTTLLPPELLFALSFAAIPLGAVPRLRGYCYPWYSPDDHWRKKVIETYDHYHPRYQEYTPREEVRCWFDQAGCYENFHWTPFGSYLARKRL